MGNCLDPGRGADDILLPDETGQLVAIGQNQPLSHEPVVWTAEIPMTEGQLQGKRDTFWETSPAYDGRSEIWDALKASAEAAEEGDFDLAQAILNGANISLPRGQLTEAYDELGNRYVIPCYCLSHPTNMQGIGDSAKLSPRRRTDDTPKSGGTPMTVKVRLSTRGKDVKVSILTTERVRDVKRKLEANYNVDAKRITMLYSGRVLNNSTLIKDLEIPKGFVIQAIVS